MDTRELYYYTTSDTMRFILTKGNIYATNLKYMNDGEEYTNGLTELRMVLNTKYKDIAKIDEDTLKTAVLQQPKIYSISFSRERDLLSQWSMYAKESGVSMRMDFAGGKGTGEYVVPLNDPGSEKQIFTEQDQESYKVPHKVYYLTKHVMNKDEYQKVCEEIISDISLKNTIVPVDLLKDIQDGIDAIWRLMAPYVKRKEFFQEAEYRMIFPLNSIATGPSATSGNGPSDVRVDYRVQDSVLKPYLDITRKDGWPVKEIMVGPGFNQKTVYDSLVHFLDNASIQIPSYSTEEIKQNGLFFLQKLDEGSGRNGKNRLESQWEELIGNHVKEEDIVNSFNCFVSEKTKRSQRQRKLLENVYMSRNGIILSVSDTPYIYR